MRLTQEDLATGMIVETRCHNLYKVYKDAQFINKKGQHITQSILVSTQLQIDDWYPLDFYDDNLNRPSNGIVPYGQGNHDIIRVYQASYPVMLEYSQLAIKKAIADGSLHLIWEEGKQEEKPKTPLFSRGRTKTISDEDFLRLIYEGGDTTGILGD